MKKLIVIALIAFGVNIIAMMGEKTFILASTEILKTEE